MKRFLKKLALGILLALPWVGASAQQVNNYCWVGAGPPVQWAPCNSTNPLSVTGSITPTGTTSNATSGVATSATNVPTVSYNYGFNGTTWDQLQVDGSKSLKVTLPGNSTVVGPTADGSAASTAPVLVAGTTDGTATGLVAVPKVSAGGLVSIDGSAVTQPVSGTVTASAPVGITPTDRTITSASGSSQQLMAANATRHSMTIINTGNANCGVNPTGGTALIGGAGTITLSALGSYTPRIPTLSAVTVICTAAQPIYGDEN